MASDKSLAQHITHYSFILWGDKFEEQVAIIFATELRRAGLPVKIVGLAGLQATGVHGLIIACDITLGDALPLANQAICVILPCSVTTIKRIENDPRVYEFFKQVCQNHAKFVLQHTEGIDHLTLQGLSIPATPFAVYTEGYDLIHFAREVASELSTRVANP